MSLLWVSIAKLFEQKARLQHRYIYMLQNKSKVCFCACMGSLDSVTRWFKIGFSDDWAVWCKKVIYVQLSRKSKPVLFFMYRNLDQSRLQAHWSDSDFHHREVKTMLHQLWPFLRIYSVWEGHICLYCDGSCEWRTVPVYTGGLISQAYVYPHKQSLLSQTIFLFLHKNRTLTALYTFLLISGPLSHFIEDVELWLARAPYLQQ